MKIKQINSNYIVFDNGSLLSYYHKQDCCEQNFADFIQLKHTGIENEEFTEPLTFEKLKEGFRFGNANKMYYVPCYSYQNGYYSNDLEILYQTIVLNSECLIVDN